MSLSMGEQLRVRRLRASGQSWRKVAATMGVSCWQSFRYQVDPDYAERRRQIQRRHKQRNREIKAMAVSKLKNKPAGGQLVIPAATEREWRARMAAVPQSVTAWLMGDPRPGQSALDHRNHA